MSRHYTAEIRFLIRWDDSTSEGKRGYVTEKHRMQSAKHSALRSFEDYYGRVRDELPFEIVILKEEKY